MASPVEGVVQQLAMHTIGGVVTPAQALMVIVPAESRLEIEAMVSNRDIGFVEVGQDAAIKVDAFNFTRYGLLQGKVLSVSPDAISHDKPQDKPTDKPQGAEASSSEPKGQELTYAARVSLDRTRMRVEGKSVNLSPGMAVHRRDQDRFAQHHQLPALAARALQAGEPAREMIVSRVTRVSPARRC